MQKLLLSAVLFMPIGVLPVDMVRAASVGPDLTLPDADRLAIETSLGKGSLGPPVSAPSIDEPSEWFPAYTGTKLFQVTQGPDAGSQQTVEWTPAKATGSSGRYQFGQENKSLTLPPSLPHTSAMEKARSDPYCRMLEAPPAAGFNAKKTNPRSDWFSVRGGAIGSFSRKHSLNSWLTVGMNEAVFSWDCSLSPHVVTCLH